jgi:hypothetical protein
MTNGEGRSSASNEVKMRITVQGDGAGTYRYCGPS